MGPLVTYKAISKALPKEYSGGAESVFAQTKGMPDPNP